MDVLSPTVPDDACVHVLAIVLAVVPVDSIVLILTRVLVLVVDAGLVNCCMFLFLVSCPSTLAYISLPLCLSSMPHRPRP